MSGHRMNRWESIIGHETERGLYESPCPPARERKTPEVRPQEVRRKTRPEFPDSGLSVVRQD